MKILALICARGNSKGIKNKNLLKFKNTTLLGNAIRQARKSKYISRIVVSTESHKIAKEAKKNRAEVPFIRPSRLARDNSPEIETWKHAIQYLSKKEDIDLVVSVPTTSPLRKTDDIDRCVYKAIREKLDFVFTVTKSSRNPYFNILRLKNKKLNVVCNNKKKIFRRQDAPTCYDMTTACYVFRPKYISRKTNLFSGKTGFVVIPKERSIDIDDVWDYQIANYLGKII